MNKIIAIVITVVLFLISGFASFSVFNGSGGGATGEQASDYKPPVDPEDLIDEDQGPKTEECPINGKLHSEERRNLWETRRPLGIMVENSLDSRPQSGLSSADVVYEAVAESGITRFLSIFYCEDAKYVGPVRSARMYFVELIEGYGNYPLYVHVGGANVDGPTDALGYIGGLGWRLYNDMDMLSGLGFPQIWRDNERLPGVATEHTVYTNTIKLWEFAEENRELTNVDEDGVEWNEDFTPWTFADDGDEADRGDIAQISYGFWSGPSYASDYNVTWDYDPETNSYLRSNGGQPHLDKNTDEQIASKNVVVVYANETRTGNDKGHLLYDVVGDGDATIFQNGNAIEATWEKETEESMMQFYDEDGEPLAFVRGHTWVSVLDPTFEIDYSEGDTSSSGGSAESDEEGEESDTESEESAEAEEEE